MKCVAVPASRAAVVWIAWLLVIAPAAAAAQATATPSPVDGALSDSVWYDAERGAVLPVHVKPVADDSLNRDSRWLPKPKRVKQAPAVTPTPAGGTGTGLFGSGLSLGNLLGWLLLLLVVAVSVALIVYAVSKAESAMVTASRLNSSRRSDAPDELTIERMKHLPAELRRTDVHLRSEAERLMAAGQYDQAIILLFGHQLLLLDRVGMLRLNRGKTNRKYVRETRAADAEVAGRLQGTVTAFERSYFGRHSILPDEFAELWQSNLELENAVGLCAEAAA
jgi:hypothetical protein